ncbi:hypothetical protein JVT61DRAFT_9011 [Boletus reticuloceps]|uniref:Uncharacterized protein n=1 Tax=Boletus reticuloceps TaxID=495285 RepID=A0A8I3A497_9AGAM|nr:hypothetical protein JVT61DRAFT_12409 [Boletus reticuloceps]KAG6371992.1 hypothetical protein JVT61DRAFT_9011 [Boletus reticuloceps]
MECKNPEKTTSKLKNALADEERGELGFAAKVARSILRWMGLSQERAGQFMVTQGAIYLAMKQYRSPSHTQYFRI